MMFFQQVLSHKGVDFPLDRQVYNFFERLFIDDASAAVLPRPILAAINYDLAVSGYNVKLAGIFVATVSMRGEPLLLAVGADGFFHARFLPYTELVGTTNIEEEAMMCNEARWHKARQLLQKINKKMRGEY